MKNFKYIHIGVIRFNWLPLIVKNTLTVNPKTKKQMTQDVLFSTQGGSKMPWPVVYIQLKSPTIYGQNLTMTTTEELISNWDVTANTTEQKLGLFNFTDASVDGTDDLYLFTGIHCDLQYQCHSGSDWCQQIGVYHSGYVRDDQGRVSGIACILSFWYPAYLGPIPSAVPTTNSMPPYVTTLSKNANPLISYTQFQTLLLKDWRMQRLYWNPLTQFSTIRYWI